MKTNISKRMFLELAKLASDAPTALGRLSQDLTRLAPHLYPFETLRDTVLSSLDASEMEPGGKMPERPADFTGDLSTSLTKLLYMVGAAHVPASTILSDSITTIRKDYVSHAEPLEAFVTEIFGCKDLLLSFKATALREDNENIVLDSKLVVDIRPVFDSETIDVVSAHTLLYRLKITHRTARDVEARIFTLSQDALDELALAIERSRKKIEKLKSRSLGESLGLLLEENK